MHLKEKIGRTALEYVQTEPEAQVVAPARKQDAY